MDKMNLEFSKAFNEDSHDIIVTYGLGVNGKMGKESKSCKPVVMHLL